MLCSSNCTNTNFAEWLLAHAFIGPKREQVVNSGSGLFEYINKSKSAKPFLLMFDEIQKIYSAQYAISFWDTIKRISQEEFSAWNIQVQQLFFKFNKKAIIAAGVYEDLSANETVTPPEFGLKFGTDLLYFDQNEIRELIIDFNQYNSEHLSIDLEVSPELHKATGG